MKGKGDENETDDSIAQHGDFGNRDSCNGAQFSGYDTEHDGFGSGEDGDATQS